MISFAKKNLDDVEVANVLGILKGDGDGLTQEYLDKRTTRLQAAIMFLRLKGLEQEALNYGGTYNFIDADKIVWDKGKSILAYLKANPNLGWQGDNHGKFHPYEVISSQAYTKVMLEALGYKQDVDFDWSEVFTFAKKLGLIKSANIEVFTNKDIATVTIETLQRNNKKGVKLIEQLIEEKAIDKELAEYCELYTPIIIEAMDSAVALNSKVIEVVLPESIDKVDTDFFEIKEGKNLLLIESAEFAPWSKDKKTVLLTLNKDLASGGLYTITANKSSINFGGRAVDNKKPRVIRATSIDYNEVSLEFSEPIRLDTLNAMINRKNFGKENLNIEGMEYINSHTIRVFTAEQDKRALYSCDIDSARDFAGNTMDSKKGLTFVGKEKSKKEQKVKRAKAIDYNQIYVEFETNIDMNTIDSAKYNVERVHFTNEKITVHDIEKATTSQVAEYDSSLTPAEREEAVKRGLILYVDGVMKKTLYKVEVDDLYTLYGQKMSSNSSDRKATFVGVVKPSGDFAYSSIEPTSATSIKVTFERKVIKDLAEDVDNYKITYKENGTTKSLLIKAAKLLDGEKSVELQIEEMKRVLYTLETEDIRDIYGNDQETGTGAKKTFVGQRQEKAISKIKSIQRMSSSDTQIKVTFDAMVGNNAKDVSLYSINQGIGYPETVNTIDGEPYSVILTIPETTETVSYKLTVKGLYNADGIAMDSDGVYGYFTGKGIAKGLPVLEAAMTVDKHTVRLYFDRDVTDHTIKGVLWGNGGMDDAEPFLQIRANQSSYSTYTTLSGLKAYPDSVEKNVLVVVDDTPSFNKGYGFTTYDVDIAPYYKNKRVMLDTSNSDIEVVAQDIEYTYPILYAIDGVDDGTVQVYFSKPIKNLPASAVSIKRTKDNKVFHVTRQPIPVSGSNNMNWLIPVDEMMTSVSYKMTLQYSQIADKYLLSKKLSTDTEEQTNVNVIEEFAGNDTHKDYIDDIYAMMPNDRTIEVYYPENMNYNPNEINTTSVHVDNINSYLIRDLSGNGNVYGTTPGIKYIEYKSDKNIAILYLDKPFHSTISTFGLVINTNMANSIGSRTVANSSNDNGPKIVQVVNDDSTINKGPGIQNAVVSGDRMTLNVTMDSVIAFGDSTHDVDTDSTYESFDKFVNKTTNITDNGTTELTVDKKLLKALKVVTTLVGEHEATISEDKVDKITIGTDGRSITFRFKKAIVPGANGYITTKTYDTTSNTDLYNYNMAKRSKSSDESIIYFAAPNTGVFDYTAPVVVEADSKAYDSNQDGKIEKIEIVFNENIIQVGSLQTALKSLTIGGTEQKVHVSTINTSNNTIVIMLSNTAIPNTGVVHVNFGFSENNNANTVADNSNNKILSNLVVDIDSFPPKLKEIEANTVGGTYAVPSVIDFKLIFNEPVEIDGLPTNKPALRLSDNIGSVSYTSGTGTDTLIFSYTVDSADTSSDLYVKEIILNNSIIHDASGQVADISFDENEFKNSHAIVISNEVPKIDSITSSSGIYKAPNKITFTMNFSAPVLVSDIPSIVLSDGIGHADYKSGSGSQSLTFEYTVKNTDNSTDLNVNSVDLKSIATIKGVNGIDANLSMPTVAFNTNHDIVIDNLEATISSMNAIDGLYGFDEAISIAIHFTKEVNVTGTPKIILADGLGTVDYKTKLDASTLIFEYRPLAGHMTNDLDIQSIDISGSTIVSNNGLNANIGYTPQLFMNTNEVKVDAKRPSITKIEMPEGAYKADVTIPIKVTFDEIVKVTGIPTLTLSDSIGSVDYASGTDSKILTFNYVVKDGDNSTNLTVVNIAGTISDIKGNIINTTLPVMTNNVVVDTIAPLGFDINDVNFIYYSNATKLVKTSGSVNSSVDERGKLQVAFAPAIGDITNIYDSALDDDMKWVANETLITIPSDQVAENKIYYRLVDHAGNPSIWIEGGVVIKPIENLTVDQVLESTIKEDGFTFTNNISSLDTIEGDEILTKVRGKIYFYNEDGTIIASQILTNGDDDNHADFLSIGLENYTMDKKIKVTLQDTKGNESGFSPLITLRVN